MNSIRLALKYINQNNNQNLKSLIKISVISISFATIALTLSICIMSGFEESALKKIRNLSSDIIIQSKNGPLNMIDVCKKLNQLNNVQFFGPTSFQHGILKNDFNNIILIKAINKNDIILNSLNLTKDNSEFKENKVFIGRKLAKELNLNVNDTTYLTTINLLNSNKKFKKTKIKILNIFESGVEEFDSKIIIIPFTLFNKLFPEVEINQINIQLNDPKKDQMTIMQLKKHFDDLQIYSWAELNPSLISALKLEKYAMFIVFFLMLIFSLTNISSLIILLITFKTKDISILKISGINNKFIKLIFFYVGYIIVLISSCIGLIIAFILGVLLKKLIYIQLPDAYYSQYVPVNLDYQIFICIFILLNLLGIAVSFISIKQIHKLDIINTLIND